MWRNAELRLTIPEAYKVHWSIIEWNARFSEDRIPEQALGASWLTARLMRFAMERWSRIESMNRWLGGTIAPRIELDLVPSLACAAHFMIAATSPARTIDDYVAAGGAMQRFWLTATSLGLQLQPEMTPLIFARYATEDRRFSKAPHAQPAAAAIAAGRAASARSLRLPLEKLLVGSL